MTDAIWHQWLTITWKEGILIEVGYESMTDMMCKYVEQGRKGYRRDRIADEQ